MNNCELLTLLHMLQLQPCSCRLWTVRGRAILDALGQSRWRITAHVFAQACRVWRICRNRKERVGESCPRFHCSLLKKKVNKDQFLIIIFTVEREFFIKCRIQCFSMNFRLVLLFSIRKEIDFYIWIRSATQIHRRQISSLNNLLFSNVQECIFSHLNDMNRQLALFEVVIEAEFESSEISLL